MTLNVMHHDGVLIPQTHGNIVTTWYGMSSVVRAFNVEH